MPEISLAPISDPAFREIDIRVIADARSGPESYVTQGVGPVENSELRKIAADIIGQVRYGLAAVASDPTAEVAPGTLEQDFQVTLAALPSDQVDAVRTLARPMVDADVALRRQLFGRVGESDVAEVRTRGSASIAAAMTPLTLDAKLMGVTVPEVRVPLSALRRSRDGFALDLAELDGRPTADELAEHLDVRKARSLTDGMDVERLAKVWGRNFFPRIPLLTPPAPAPPDPTRFSVDVVSFTCVDETNPEAFGSDEYALGGTTIDESGDTGQVGERAIGGGFDDGDSRGLNWNSWTWFSLLEQGGLDQGWPKSYRAVFVLAEKDNGGLATFLNKLYEQVRDRVKKAVAEFITGIGTPWLGPVISAAIGQAVAWIVDQVINWLISLFNDDIFPVHVTTMTHVARNGRFTVDGVWGSMVSPVYRAHFYGHGGHAVLDYRWRLHD